MVSESVPRYCVPPGAMRLPHNPPIPMKVLVVGSGGREHALCWKIAQSPDCEELYCAPGNGGTQRVATNVELAATDTEGILAFAQEQGIGLVVIGPEDPLCNGLADRLRDAGIPCFGPGAAGARLEGSKSYAKEVLDRHRIPTASYRRFHRSGEAKDFLNTCTLWPQVVKADGLAAGKGVFICQGPVEACSAVDAIMEERFLGNAAGESVVIEEFLEGEECSIFAITDGEAILILEPVVDHKQVGEGDTGPNTGGMGVYSPAPSLGQRVLRQIEQRIIIPSVHAVRREELAFRGVLFIGLMLTESGPKVLEYNVRFGDPETQALVRRFQGDLLPYLAATANGTLKTMDPPDWDRRYTVGVVGASEGYPGEYAKGSVISGLDAAEEHEDVVVFHAGTAAKGEDVVTAGGRVLCVTSMAEDIDSARERAYAGYDEIQWAGKFCRRDIGGRVEARKTRVAQLMSSKASSTGGGQEPGLPLGA